MFKNIGRKIKVLAQVVFWVGVIGSCVAGLVVMAEMESAIGLLIMLGGGATALISGWLAYGFGELIDKTTEIAQNANTLPKIQMAVKNLPHTEKPPKVEQPKPVGQPTVTQPNKAEQLKPAIQSTVTQPPKAEQPKQEQYKIVTKEDGPKTKEDLILEKWRDQGIITEEEYQKLIAK